MTPEEKAAAEAERGARTIFAKCLPPRASEREVKEFFEQAGEVREVRRPGVVRARRRWMMLLTMVVVAGEPDRRQALEAQQRTWLH